ncbi:Nudix hydrolase 11 [Capsicum annuum]|nr:Nudix hydrolase 11 [Capsicum annuum]
MVAIHYLAGPGMVALYYLASPVMAAIHYLAGSVMVAIHYLAWFSEVALPGGKVEEDDADDIETALREAEEEIGLDRSLVDVVTVLESLPARNRITVIPVVGILWDRNAFNPVINTAEVEAIFDAPLEMFLKDENRREKEIKYMGDEYLIHFFDHETENGKYMIWALTAGILIKTASIVYQRPPDFQVRMPRFWNRSRQ